MPPQSKTVTVESLAAEGWSLDAAKVKAAAEECEISEAELLASILDQDIKKVGAAGLPDDVNRSPQTVIKGPLVLQVDSVVDVSRPSYKDQAHETDRRLLTVKLTDGKITCKAFEYKQ